MTGSTSPSSSVCVPKASTKKPGSSSSAASKTAASTAPATPENYTYQTGGRRDPFTSLIGTGTEPRAPLQRGEGLGKVLGQPIRRGRKVTLGRPL